MKKRFMGLLAMAGMLFATSCSEDVVLSQSTGDEVKVTFTTELRDDVKSRTVGDDTDHIDQLQFCVYQNNVLLPLLSQTLDENDFTSGENGTKKATIEVVLVKGQTYSFAFWAQNSEYTAYRFDENTAKVEIDLNSVQTNNRAGDAFFKSVIDHKVNGTFSQEITLKRPFAQVNFLTTEEDLQKAEKAVFIPTQSNIKIENVASELNVLTGEVNNGQYVELDMGQLLKQTGGVLETTKIQGSNVEYRYLATAYVLPTDPKNPVKVNASMEVDGGTGVNTFLAVENIDIQRNYRTNIYGNLLTDNGTFNVTIDPGFNEPETNFPGTDAEKLAYAAKNGGTVELADDVVLDEPLMVEGSMVLNMESYKLNGSILVAAGGNLTINGGTISNELFTDYSSIESKGSLTLNNVNVSSIRHAVRIESGSAVINGGNYTIISKQGRTQHALNVSGNSNVIVKGGTFVGSKGTSNDSGAAVNVQSGSTVTIEGGSFSKGKNKTLANAGTLIVKGGSFDQDPSSYVADGYKVVGAVDNWCVVANDVTVAATSAEVMTVFENGGTVLLTSDIQLENVLNVKEGAEVNLDLNGKTIIVNGTSAADPVFETSKGSTLTITGNGKVVIDNPAGSLIIPNGDVVIENGTFVRNVPEGTPANKVGALFVGTKGSQTVTIKGGYFDGGYYDRNAADIEELLNGTKTLTETTDDIANRGNSKDVNTVRVALKNNISRTLNLSSNLFKVYGGTFVGANPAWGDEGCMLPTTPNYLRPWSYYQGALLDGQTFNENGIVLPEGYNITKGVTEDNRPTYTVTYNK